MNSAIVYLGNLLVPSKRMKKLNKIARRHTPLFFCLLLVAAFELTGALTATAQQTDNPTPPASECNETSERGRMKVDVTANRLYICTATGWKSTVLQ